MHRPMIPLTFSVAVLYNHTRLARLETNDPIIAAIGTADDDLVHQIMVEVCCLLLNILFVFVCIKCCKLEVLY